jgi:hypothetical protein
MKKMSACWITVLALTLFSPHPAYSSPSSSLSIFAGQSNQYDLLDLARFRFGGFEPYSIFGINYARAFYSPSQYFHLEWAGQIVKHFEKFSLFEVDAMAAFRWKWFPWNEWITTSLALGEGLSLASGYPSSESISQNIHSNYLNYLWVDIRLGVPSIPKWKLDFIIHHRSGIYGLINGVSGGSNYLCIGITREFE